MPEIRRLDQEDSAEEKAAVDVGETSALHQTGKEQRKVAILGNSSSGGGGGNDKDVESGWGPLDLIHDNWHVLFFAIGLASILSNGKKLSRGKLVQQIVGLAGLVIVSFKIERILSRNVISPLLNKLFGDNEELRKRIERQEREMREKLNELKQGTQMNNQMK